MLVLVYWVNRAVLLFDQLIANGESAMVFVELSILTLPLMISQVLPVAAFAAAVFITNRLSAENELVVAQSTGFGPFRMARPVLIFGLLTGLFLAVLNHVLVPMSQERLSIRKDEIAENITARFLTEGSFVHPTDGVTFYIREITRDGEMLDIFLSDVSNEAHHVVYSAERALVLRSQEGPRLIMFKGLAQVLETGSTRLTITAFDELTYNLAALIEGDFLGGGSYKTLSTLELLRARPSVLATTGASRVKFLYEAHTRIASTLLAPIAALIGFSTLLLGGFSRFGLWRQIFASVFLLVSLEVFDNLVSTPAKSSEALVGLVYAPVLAGMVLVVLILWISPRQAMFRRRSRQVVAT